MSNEYGFTENVSIYTHFDVRIRNRSAALRQIQPKYYLALLDWLLMYKGAFLLADVILLCTKLGNSDAS